MRITLNIDVVPDPAQPEGTPGATLVKPIIAISTVTATQSGIVTDGEDTNVVNDGFNVLGQVLEFAKSIRR